MKFTRTQQRARRLFIDAVGRADAWYRFIVQLHELSPEKLPQRIADLHRLQEHLADAEKRLAILREKGAAK